MGHFHSTNLDKLLLRQIYAKGSVSINDAVAVAEKRKEKFHASEGNYEEKYMLQMGMETLLFVHVDREELEPILKTRKEKRAYRRWRDNELDEEFGNDGESIGDLAILDSIKFKFKKGQRVHYKKLIIPEVES